MADEAVVVSDKAAGRGRNWRSAPEEIWALIREDYLSGDSAEDCCRRHGVGVATMRQRAALEGWRKADQPWAPPRQLDPYDEGRALEDKVGGDLDQVEVVDLSWVAHRRMLRAVLRGDASEALRWRRVRTMMEEEKADLERFIEQEEAYELQNRPADPPYRDSLDGLDGSHPVLVEREPSDNRSGPNIP